MIKIAHFFLITIFICSYALFSYALESPLITAAMQNKMTPDDALHRLQLGNQRFVKGKPLETDFIKKAQLSASGQYPVSVILSCIDSRVPPEIVFDQNIGNVFVARAAANVISDDVLGGLEFATQVSGAKLIVVMGHDACGAIRGACENVKLGYLTQLLAKIQPSIRQTTTNLGKKDCQSAQFINQAAAENVRHIVKMIPEKSQVIRQLVKEGKVKIVGAMYELHTGRVVFLNN
ncbi:MAG: hypothetical protein A3F12_03010 [Gammaproteobacteria bacterium RIFCSPHIGHO2_12_FULL_38_14]|nr:MAG: hypothetical protein A3F12_03010 [Gammaproteobacteria bacterium RIFCSPHIGHO2_12_FULL_38_14]